MPFWQVCVSLGGLVQAHQALLFAFSMTVVVLCGLARLPWRALLHARRPRR